MDNIEDTEVTFDNGMRSKAEVETAIAQIEVELEQRDDSNDSHCRSKRLVLLQSKKVLEWVLNQNEEFTYFTTNTKNN